MTFDKVLDGGHLAEILDYAARCALAAWEEMGTTCAPISRELEAALRLLRDVAPVDPPESYDPVPFIESNVWTFAKTQPRHPHEYLLLRQSTDWKEHLVFVQWLRLYGELERFGGQLWPYRTVKGWRYWAGADPNWTIVNRRQEPGAGSPMLRLWETP